MLIFYIIRINYMKINNGIFTVAIEGIDFFLLDKECFTLIHTLTKTKSTL